MVRVRKLVLAIAAATAMLSETAHALGLGEVNLQSALNQPLSADIELLDTGDLGPNEILPVLASPEDFNKAGVDRNFFLTDLKFTPVVRPNGKSIIHVTSTKPVREPYLNFLVEVTWPSGRLLREYTLLLDPPLYSPQTAAAAAPQLPVAPPAPRPAAVKPAPSVSEAPPGIQRVTDARPATASSADGHRTTPNDTLWEVAERNRAGGSVHQAMLAIQDLNPDAFVDGNINRMKSGQVLRMPSEQQILRRSQSEAIAEVAAQNAAWRSTRTGGVARQLDATHKSAAGIEQGQAEGHDNLRLVSPGSGTSTSGGDKGAATGTNKALSDKLAVTQESLDSSRRESEELKSRVSDLQGQLDKLQRLIQLKDDQLAKLQAELAGQDRQSSASVAPAPASPPQNPAVPANTPPPSSSGDNAAPVQVAPAAPAAPAPVEPKVEAQKPVTKSPAAKPAPAPAPEPGFMDDLMSNPVLLGALGGVALLVLLIALMISSRRRAMKEAEIHHSIDLSTNGFDDDLGLHPAEFDELVSEASVPEAEESVVPRTNDVLGEADIYIAYGRFNQAAELLLSAINDEPNRADLRLKLMEVYAELGDRDGFVRQEGELREIGGASAEVDQLKLRYPGMAAASLAIAAAVAGSSEKNQDLDLDNLHLDEMEPVASEEASDFDLNFDEFVADLEKQPASESRAAEEDEPFDLGELGHLDFTAPESSTPEQISEGEVAAREDDFGLGVDLEDFDLGLDEPATPKEASIATEEPVTEAVPSFEDAAAVSDLPSDFDLSTSGDDIRQDDFAAQLERVSAELDDLSGESDEPAVAESEPVLKPGSLATDLEDDDFDFLSGTDENATKLDLARAYIDMGDSEGARDILDEVLVDGDDTQQQEAKDLLARLA